MKLFECQNCGQLLYFENTRCERCGHALGYLYEKFTLSALTPASDAHWHALADPKQRYRYCANRDYEACNWLVPEGASAPFCRACQFNRTIPDLNQPDHRQHWRKLEGAKHRLVYSLSRFGLPLSSKAEQPETGLAFDFLAEPKAEFRENAQVITGHAQGVITLNIAEADDAERERQRLTMAEPYRTLIGHFRHEIGHYYWERLVRDSDRLASFRELFGDERHDYAAALEEHYGPGPHPDWSRRFISVYASAHPWEDWAETWAHYLHIVDVLETAHAFGLRLNPKAGSDETLAAEVEFDAYRQGDFDALMDAWFPLTYAVNSLNRSMGQPDLYPFVLVPAVLEKLRFVHQTIRLSSA